MRCLPLPTRAARRSKTLLLFVHVHLPIFVGGGIYSLWRSNRLLVFAWYRWLGLEPALDLIRERMAIAGHFIPPLILYSLPDALWVYSFTALMCLLWFEEPPSRERGFWIVLPAGMAVGAEFGQLLKVVPGTFDWGDVVAYFAAFLAAFMIMRALTRRPKMFLEGA